MGYTVTLRDRSAEYVDGADAFDHERLMTTFFRTNNARGAVDCWSVPLASFRTDEILMIRRVETEVVAPTRCNRISEALVDREPRVVV